MTASIVGFKVPEADLHRKSPKIFLASISASIVIVAVGIHIPFGQEANLEKRVKTTPVIIQLENIPETRQAVKPSFPKLSIPLEVGDDLMPDDVTIESTELDLNAVPPVPPAPPVHLVPDMGAAVEEEEIFELFAVEEEPERINTIFPVYPEMAKRTGIEGTVYLKVLVNKKGLIDSVEVIKGPKIFHNPSIEAAKLTKFTPAKHNDMPVYCWVIMPFRFIFEK